MTDLDAIRQRLKDPLHEALHTLGARIPGLDVGDCHCNLLAEVALDALIPALADIAAAEARGYAKAVARLRYGQRIADLAWQANTALPDVSLRAAADFLEAEATRETDRA